MVGGLEECRKEGGGIVGSGPGWYWAIEMRGGASLRLPPLAAEQEHWVHGLPHVTRLPPPWLTRDWGHGVPPRQMQDAEEIGMQEMQGMQ